MRRMKMIFIILVCLGGGLQETGAMSVTGVSGEAINIKCSHSNAFSNVKYFCKGTCQDEDILISSRKEKRDPNGKYSINDKGNTFYVTISHLTEDDSGTYWCGIDRFGVDTYNEVVLTVIQGKSKEADSDLNDFPQSISNDPISTTASSSTKLVYIGAGLGVVVLALAVVLLVFFRYRSRHISTSSGKVHETVYEGQETDGSTNSIQHRYISKDQADNIYSDVNISSVSQTQPDSLFYATVNCNKHTDCSSVTPPSAAVTYSTIKYTSTDESTVYCNV